MIDYFKTILTGQFEASLRMLDKCIRECPPEHWESKIANGTFRQVAYHTLFYGDLYLCPGLEEFEPADVTHRGGLRPADIETCIGLTKDDTLEYLAACRRKAVQTLAAETPDSLQAPALFPWLSLSRGELHWYNIRHIQHHTGQLSAYLRRATGSREDWWVDSGWQKPLGAERDAAADTTAIPILGKIRALSAAVAGELGCSGEQNLAMLAAGTHSRFHCSTVIS